MGVCVGRDQGSWGGFSGTLSLGGCFPASPRHLLRGCFTVSLWATFSPLLCLDQAPASEKPSLITPPEGNLRERGSRGEWGQLEASTCPSQVRWWPWAHGEGTPAPAAVTRVVPSPLGIHGEASLPCRALLVVLNSVGQHPTEAP